MKQGGKKIAFRLLGLILAGLLLGLLFGGGRARAEESSTETVDMQITYGQEASREMLEYINLFRTGKDIDGEYTGYIDTDNVTQVMVTGLQPLEYDYNLEKVAMQRAAEIALSFSHTRPNGTGCYTALLEVQDAEGVQYHGLGENIAAGYSTALQTFRQWREDGEDYAYQGHRRNMLSNNYNGIGIGHVVVGGRHFWAQALGRTDDGHGTETAAAQGTRSVPVEIKTAYMTDVTAQAEPASVTVDVGMSRALPQAAITFQYSDPDNWPGGVVFSAKAHPSWTVKKTSVARIENGLLRGVAVGSTKLTATVYGSSVSASVVCENLGTPSVTTQPADASGYIDSNVTFSVEAAGRELTYKWEYKKSASAAWKTWSSNSGRTQTVAVTEVRNGYLFRCRITDVYGNQVTSDEAKLTVKPKITAQPKAVSATVGAAAQFSVTATGAGLQYRWQFSKDDGSTWKNVTDQNEGYNTSVLKLTVKDAWNGYRYRCAIKDANGKTVRSSGVKLTVNPKITAQPAAVSAYVGGRAVFTVNATGAGLQYRWQFSKDEGTTWRDVTSANEGYTAATLKPVVKAAWNGYRYRCRITDANGTILYSAGAELTVKPRITSQPVSVSARAGETVTFTVKATGAGLQYRWQVSKDGGETWKNVTEQNEGYNTSVLKLKVKAAWNGYCYRCVIRDANGLKRISHAAELTVK